MNKTAKLIIVIVLIAAIAGVAMMKKSQKNNASTLAPPIDVNKISIAIEANLPRLLDLGADKCIPCKMMAPILEEMKTRHKDKLVVDFIDVWKDPNQARNSGIRVIPTQIFYDSTGKELFRHEGFLSKEEIIAKWKEFGVDLNK